MKIGVCVKGVVDTEQTLEVVDGQLQDNGGVVLNPYDKHAVEAALQLAEATDGTVVAIATGAGSEKALREALALGATDAVQVTGEGAAPALLAAAIQAGDYELVLCGDQAADDNQGAAAAVIAQLLDWPLAQGVDALATLDAGIQTAATLEAGVLTQTLALPAVVAVADTINKPRLPSFRTKMAAKRAKLTPLAVEAAAVPVAERVALMPKPPVVKQLKLLDADEAGIAALKQLLQGDL